MSSNDQKNCNRQLLLLNIKRNYFLTEQKNVAGLNNLVSLMKKCITITQDDIRENFREIILRQRSVFTGFDLGNLWKSNLNLNLEILANNSST